MANLMDYIDWRGDLTFGQAPFNEVDNLILAELSYIDLRGIIPGVVGQEGLPLRDAAARYFTAGRDKTLEGSVLVPEQIPAMLEKMSGSARFGGLRLNCCEEHFDTEKAEQFAAVTVELPDKTAYLSFRGTDDTLVGWKEDFNMTFLETVPSQTRAVEYVKRVAGQYRGWKLRLGGHSKGGNLAVYSAVNCGKAIQNRLLAVYNNDGPGFRENLLRREEHRRVADRILTILPKSSVVGLLLEHEEDFIVVDSTQVGVLQHDGFSWCVQGPQFVRMEDLSGVEINDQTLKEWVNGLDLEQRETFFDALFGVLSASGASTLAEMRAQGAKSAVAMLKAMVELDKETRAALNYAIGVLFIKSSAQSLLDDWKRESKRRKQKKAEREPE